jgi:hypothetical protein
LTIIYQNMKIAMNTKITGALVLSLIFGQANAQLTASAPGAQDHTVKMSMKMEGLPAEYAAYGEQEITTYMKGERSKTEMASMMGSSTVFYDGKTMTSLTDAMGNKMGFTATKAELEATNKTEAGDKPKIEYVNEKKTIAGYECGKAIVTTVGKDKKENKATVWYTDKIKSNHSEASKARGRGSLDLSDLKGYPLSMEMNMNQNGMDVKIIMTATEVSTNPIDDSVFAISTEGYKMMTYKEMQEKQKAMMQGK